MVAPWPTIHAQGFDPGPSPLSRSGKVDFSAYKRGVKSATMRMFFGSLDQHGKGDGVITMQEWLKIMGQLGDKVRENPDPGPSRTFQTH